jgi:hypothetical protein
MGLAVPPKVGASALMTSASRYTPTRLSTYDTTMLASPASTGTRNVKPKPPTPIRDMPMKPQTAGIAARIIR